MGLNALPPATSYQIVVSHNAAMALEPPTWMEYEYEPLTVRTDQQYQVSRGCIFQPSHLQEDQSVSRAAPFDLRVESG
jgi:hypothetical protein